MQTKLTDPSYVSENMFDLVVKEKFQNSANDAAMQDQATKLLQMFQASQSHDQTIVDILHASKFSRRKSKQDIAEIGFLMGLQFGFELALTFPPLSAT